MSKATIPCDRCTDGTRTLSDGRIERCARCDGKKTIEVDILTRENRDEILRHITIMAHDGACGISNASAWLTAVQDALKKDPPDVVAARKAAIDGCNSARYAYKKLDELEKAERILRAMKL